MADGPAPAVGAEQRTLEKGWITLPAEGRSGPPPALPASLYHLDEVQRKAVGELWGFWWSSPMALMWSVHDTVGLGRLALMTVMGGEASELRQMEDRYGLNPVGRRRLYWRIEGVDAPSKRAEDLSGGRGKKKGRPPAAGGASDPRLSVVNGGKAG